jgi:hypothetical protein
VFDVRYSREEVAFCGKFDLGKKVQRKGAHESANVGTQCASWHRWSAWERCVWPVRAKDQPASFSRYERAVLVVVLEDGLSAGTKAVAESNFGEDTARFRQGGKGSEKLAWQNNPKSHAQPRFIDLRQILSRDYQKINVAVLLKQFSDSSEFSNHKISQGLGRIRKKRNLKTRVVILKKKKERLAKLEDARKS